MNQTTNIQLQNDRLLVSGDINFVTAVNLWNQSLPLVTNAKVLSFDFIGVTSSNSAGLALLIEWIKLAGRTNKKIQFINLPEQISSVAAVAGIKQLINCAANLVV